MKVKSKQPEVGIQLSLLGSEYISFEKLAEDVVPKMAIKYTDVKSMAVALAEVCGSSADYRDLTYWLIDVNGASMAVATEWLDMSTLSDTIAYNVTLASVSNAVKLELEALARMHGVIITAVKV